jgi:NitT/TauT family transport system substrate-binding protein
MLRFLAHQRELGPTRSADSRSNWRVVRSIGLIVTIGALILTACAPQAATPSPSGSSAATAAPTAKPLTKLRLGSLTNIVTAPAYLGVQEGFFKAEGLDVEIETTAAGTAPMIPLLVSGNIQLLLSNPQNAYLMALQGIPYTIMGSTVNMGPQDHDGIFVKSDSGIKTGKDFNSKTICVSGLLNANDLTFSAWIHRNGGDLATVQKLTIPQTALVDSATRNQCAGIALGEPQYTQALTAGLVKLDDPYSALGGLGTPKFSYGGLQSWVYGNPELAAAFNRAMKKSIDFAAKNCDAVRKILPSYTGVTLDVAMQAVCPNFDNRIFIKPYQNYADVAFELKFLPSKPDVSLLVWKNADIGN